MATLATSGGRMPVRQDVHAPAPGSPGDEGTGTACSVMEGCPGDWVPPGTGAVDWRDRGVRHLILGSGLSMARGSGQTEGARGSSA